MTDLIKRKFPRHHFATSAFAAHFERLHFHGSLTLTSVQRHFNDAGIVDNFNITSYPHILTDFPADKNSGTKALTNWQFDKKTAQVLNFHFIIIKIVLL